MQETRTMIGSIAMHLRIGNPMKGSLPAARLVICLGLAS